MHKLIGLWITALLVLTTSCGARPLEDNKLERATDSTLEESSPSIISPETELTESALEVISTDMGGSDTVIDLKPPLVFRVDVISEDLGLDMTGKSFHENDQIQLEDLRVLQMGYYGFDGIEHQGSMVVHEAIAKDILEIFQELFDARYPIEVMETIDKYNGDDDASMVANNTSAFNYRLVSGSKKLSNHAYGLAVDINPLINPWVGDSGVFPQEGEQYADRTMDQQGMVKKGDACYEAFTSRGFQWGGDWKSSKDYQHFDIKIKNIND